MFPRVVNTNDLKDMLAPLTASEQEVGPRGYSPSSSCSSSSAPLHEDSP